MSSRTHICSRPGEARYCNRSCNRGIISWGSCNVFCLLMYSQVQFAILSSLPKHRSNVAS